jgi:hypothetical protein
MEGLGQLFSKETQAIFYNWKEKPVQVGCGWCQWPTQHERDKHTKTDPDHCPCHSQRMLDFDFLCGECCCIWIINCMCVHLEPCRARAAAGQLLHQAQLLRQADLQVGHPCPSPDPC